MKSGNRAAPVMRKPPWKRARRGAGPGGGPGGQGPGDQDVHGDGLVVDCFVGGSVDCEGGEFGG